MKLKEGDMVSQYRMNKLMAGHTQKMWQKETSGWKQVALTTIFEGGQTEVKSAIDMNQYQLCLARSETQQIRWIWDSKKNVFIKFACISTMVKKPAPPAPTPAPAEADEIGDDSQ